MSYARPAPKTATCSLCLQSPLFCNNQDNPALQALQLLKCYAEKTPERKFHLTVITGKVSQAAIDPEWLTASGYKHYKGSGKSNMDFFLKTYEFYGVRINHYIHKNGTWTLQISPRVTQASPEKFMDKVNMILTSAFSGSTSHDIKVKRLEISRPETTEILQWMKSQNIKEIKAYIHDNYEARIEVTYYDPPLNPTTAQVLQYCT